MNFLLTLLIFNLLFIYLFGVLTNITEINVSRFIPNNFYNNLKASSFIIEDKSSAKWEGYDRLKEKLEQEEDINPMAIQTLAKANNDWIEKVQPKLGLQNPKLHSIEEAYNYALYAGASYCSPTQVAQWSCSPYCRKTNRTNVIHLIKDKTLDIEGYMAKFNKELIVSIRGSRSLTNWILDAVIVKTPIQLPPPYNQAKVHLGFNKAALAVLPQISQVIKTHLSMDPQITITLVGHSLGGAIMALLAHYLTYDNVVTFNQLQLITYGQPRVGDMTYASYLNLNLKKVTRVTHRYDPVPIIPFIKMGYWHHGNEMFIMGEDLNAPNKICNGRLGSGIDSLELNKGEDITCIANPLQLRIWQNHFRYWDITLDDCK